MQLLQIIMIQGDPELYLQSLRTTLHNTTNNFCAGNQVRNIFIWSKIQGTISLQSKHNYYS